MTNNDELIIADLGISVPKLDDDVILNSYVDKDGNDIESLRLNLMVNGSPIFIRFPSYGHWNNYTRDLGKLFMILSTYAENLQVSGLLAMDSDRYSIWAALSGAAIKTKKVTKLIETIFFKYLKPSIHIYGFDRFFVPTFIAKLWSRRNLGMDFVFKMFVAILLIDEWLKKKSTLLLKKVYLKETSQDSSAPSMKNMGSQLLKSIRSLNSESVVDF